MRWSRSDVSPSPPPPPHLASSALSESEASRDYMMISSEVAGSRIPGLLACISHYRIEVITEGAGDE